MNTKLRLFPLLAVSTLFLFTVGCGKQDRTDGVAQDKPVMTGYLTDKPIAAYQNELLDLAFATASAIPIEPHIKDRSRAQAIGVAASLKLDQPLRALRLIEKIDTRWRRGAGYAELAFYCAMHGDTAEAQRYLDFAMQISESAEDWRRDQIRIKIADTYTLLGQTGQASQSVMGLADAESGVVAGVMAMAAHEDYFEEQLNNLDALLVSGNFDIVKNALKACASLFNRFYDDVGRRLLTEEKMKVSWGALPFFLRVELLTEMAGYALDHKDQAKALDLINEAQNFMAGAQWPPEHRISLMSKLVTLRFNAGDRQKAEADADAMLALFDAQRDKIVNIDRAGALRPLAEAYQSMGNTTTALTVYKRAVEEGVENPNSRPCAEDLSATCLSMALNKAEPDAELCTRIRKINEGLGEPW